MSISADFSSLTVNEAIRLNPFANIGTWSGGWDVSLKGKKDLFSAFPLLPGDNDFKQDPVMVKCISEVLALHQVQFGVMLPLHVLSPSTPTCRVT